MSGELTELGSDINMKKPIWVKILAVFYILSLFPISLFIPTYFVILMFSLNIFTILMMVGMVIFPIVLVYTVFIAFKTGNKENFSLGARRLMLVPVALILFFPLSFYVPYFVSSSIQNKKDILSDSNFEQNMAKVNVDIVEVIERMKQNSPEIVSYSCGKTGRVRLSDMCADIRIKIEKLTEADERRYLLSKITYLEEVKKIVSSSFLGEKTNISISFDASETNGSSKMINCSEKIYPNRDEVVFNVPLRAQEDGIKCIIYVESSSRLNIK